jgi:hypothetical protein
MVQVLKHNTAASLWVIMNRKAGSVWRCFESPNFWINWDRKGRKGEGMEPKLEHLEPAELRCMMSRLFTKNIPVGQAI